MQNSEFGTIIKISGPVLDVQFPGFAVGAQAAIVVDPVGAVGILLDLTDQDPGADGMDGPRLDEKHVPRTDFHLVQHLGHRA
ncbi:MAG: hypothetical protein KH334_04820, partial [Clostridiales bacterium]|nr:hypothetical protein [Clostridiales bacterium]